jgi:hypothetical protein
MTCIDDAGIFKSTIRVHGEDGELEDEEIEWRVDEFTISERGLVIYTSSEVGGCAADGYDLFTWPEGKPPRSLDELVSLVTTWIRDSYGCLSLEPGAEPLTPPAQSEVLKQRLEMVNAMTKNAETLLEVGHNRHDEPVTPRQRRLLQEGLAYLPGERKRLQSDLDEVNAAMPLVPAAENVMRTRT